MTGRSHRGEGTIQVAAGLGLFGIVIGCAIVLAGCAGVGAALILSPVPVVLGFAAVVLIAVAIARRATAGLDSAIVAALFTAAFSILGGVIEMGMWMGWPVLFHRP